MIKAISRAALGGVLAVALCANAAAEKLPVFKLAPANTDAAKAQSVLADAQGGQGIVGIKAGRGINGLMLQRGPMTLEVDQRSGYYFLSDTNFFLNPESKGQAPNEVLARKVADQFVQKNALLPQSGEVTVAFSGYSVSGVTIDRGGQKEERILDRHVNYAAQIVAGGRTFPVVGGGGDFKVAVGDRGRVIGYSGGWRTITGIADTVEIKTQQQALAEWMAVAGPAKLRGMKMYLAYYAAPSFERQDFLMPVWVLSGRIQTAAREMPLRIQIIPAAAKYLPFTWSKRPNFQKRPPQLKRPQLAKPEKEARNQSPGLIELLIPEAKAQARREADSDCSTWWNTFNLPRVVANRQGFLDGCRAIGFTPLYDWGDANAWEEDFNLYDDYDGADNSDVVFYTGHADYLGWILSPPADGAMDAPEVGPDAAGVDDKYGKTDMEHLIIAACGPHQSRSFTTGVDHAVDRWRRIFGGLHTFQGYGAITFDTDSEGRRFTDLIRSGRSVIYAWARTGMDIQPATNGEAAPDGPNVYVTGMYSTSRRNPLPGSCIGRESLVVGGAGCADIPSSDVSIVFYYIGT